MLWQEKLRAATLVKTLLEAQVPKQIGVETIQSFVDCGLAKAYGRGLGLKWKDQPARDKDGMRRATGPDSFEAELQKARKRDSDGRQAR